MALSEGDIDIIRSTFATLRADSVVAGEVFYGHLFRIAPQTRPMFKNSMSAQATKLMSTLGVVVSQLQNWDALTPVVQNLACQHVDYGVTPDHYDAVALALDAMLTERLGALYSDDAREAWLNAYAALADTMTEFAYPDYNMDVAEVPRLVC